MPFRIIVVLCGGIVAALMSAGNPFFGLLVLVFLVFARPQDDRPNLVPLHIPLMIVSGITLGLLLRLGTVILPIFAALRRMWLMLLLYFLMLVSAAANGWTPWSQNRLYDYGTLMFLCVVALALLTTEKRLRIYVLAFMGSGLTVALRVIRNPSHMREEIGGQQFARLGIAKGITVFGDPNYLALLMALTISIALALLDAYKKKWQRAGLVAVIGTAFYVFFRANSRGASIALVVMLFAHWLMRKNKIKAVLIGLPIIGIAMLLAPSSYWARLQTIANYQSDESATSRLELWDTATHLIAANPALGVGPDDFIYYAPNTPHQAYLQIGSEVGIPALVVYVAILSSGIFASLRVRSRCSPDDERTRYLYALASGALGCVVCVVVQGFFTGLAHREVVYGSVTLAYCIHALALNTETNIVPTTAEVASESEPATLPGD